jgi:threonine dehydratase
MDFSIDQVSLRSIFEARNRISNNIYRTPLLLSETLSEKFGLEVYLKLECWQICGCFKVRGALNLVSALSIEERNKGLITASSGNHGTALSYAASLFGKPPVTIFVPDTAESVKINKIKSYGAQIVFAGENYTKALQKALAYEKKGGGTYAHSHGDPLVISGQGTIGIEIMEDLPDVENILIPVGGGGLLSGVATAAKTINSKVKIYGIETEAAPGAYNSFKNNKLDEDVEILPSLADGLLGTLTPLTFEIAKKYTEDIVVVSEETIKQSMCVFQEAEQLMIEGSASVGLAAILSGKVKLRRSSKCVLILTGRNISAKKYNEAINEKY